MNLNNLLLKRTPFDSEVLLRNASLHTTSISMFEEHSAHGKISYKIFLGLGMGRHLGHSICSIKFMTKILAQAGCGNLMTPALYRVFITEAFYRDRFIKPDS